MKKKDLSETGKYKTLKTKADITVKDLIKELFLDPRICKILVNGKVAKLETIIKLKDEVIILPILSGGFINST